MLKKDALRNSRDEIREQIVSESFRYVGIRERPVNRGPEIDSWNQAVGAPLGSPYCASFASHVVKKVLDRFAKSSRFHPHYHVKTMWNENKEMRERYPRPGFIAVWLLRGTIKGHCGIVTHVDEKLEHMETVEANTSFGQNKRMEREGQGVERKHRPVGPFDGFELLGFIDPLKMKWE